MSRAIEWSEVAGEVKGQMRRQAPKLLALAIATGLELALRRRLKRQAPKLLALAIGTGAEMMRQRRSPVRGGAIRKSRAGWKLLLVTGLAATAVLALNRR
jgi:hypothetical protein